MKRLVALLAVLLFAPALAFAAPVKALKVTVLSTMLADRGIGEWGYAALVEADGRKILYDTGARPQTVLANAKELGVDLSDVEDVILSHHHGDHTGGVVALRKAFMAQNPRAFSRVHVAEGFLLPGSVGPRAGIPKLKADLEAAGATIVVHKGPEELAPGVWLTGPVPRHTDERNYPLGIKLQTAAGIVEDNVPDDQALVFDTPEGVVVLTGCGHAGAINIVDDARTITRGKPLLALIGGLHIYNAPEARVVWTGEQLKADGVKFLLMGHCTGPESAFRLRQITGLTRKTAVYGAVGATFVLGQGIAPGEIAG